MSPPPPRVVRIARALLSHTAPRDDRDFIVGDLDEDYVRELATRGPARARNWYVAQVVRSLIPLIRQRITIQSASRQPRPSMWHDVSSDFRDAIRRARRAPAFASTIVLTVALGIGASTAVYAVVRGVLLTPLPFAGSARVVRLETNDLKNPADLPSDTWLDFVDWRAAARSYEAIAGIWEGGTSRTFQLADQTSSFPVAVVTDQFADVFGVHALRGRLFEPNDFLPQGPYVIALSERFWRTRLGSDSAVVGRVLTVADTARVVIGVLADAHTEYPGPNVAGWIPLAPVPGKSMSTRGTRYLALFGRLKPGITSGDARTELQSLIQRTAETDAQRARAAAVTPLLEKLSGPVRPGLMLLAAVVGVALLVAAGNMAVMLLAQAESRARELAIRASLGSAISRLARKLIVESLLFAGVGGVFGVVLARGLVSAIIAYYPGRFVRAQDAALSAPVLAAAIGLTALIGMASALPLIRRLTRTDLIRDLREGAGTSTRRALRLRQVLAGAQLAFAVALVTSGGLLARSFVRLLGIDPGFTTQGVGYLQVSSSAVKYPVAADMLEHLDGAERVVRALPGVTIAAGVNYLPLPGRIVGWGTRMFRTDDPAQHEHQIQFRQMTPDYLATMSIPLKQGRNLATTDDAAATRVALINETLARDAFGTDEPMGKTILVQSQTWTVIGVVGDMRYWDLSRPVVGEVFVPPSQAVGDHASGPFAFRSVVFRTGGNPGAVIAAARSAIHAADPSLVVSVTGTLSDRVAAASAPERFRAILVGSLAVVALILAAFGLFAVTAHAVAARTREIGIRAALGASSHRIARTIIRDALSVTALGTIGGLALAWASSRGIQRFLTGADGMDAVLCGEVALAFAVVSLVAAALPARRASRVDPVIAMRAGN